MKTRYILVTTSESKLPLLLVASDLSHHFGINIDIVENGNIYELRCLQGTRDILDELIYDIIELGFTNAKIIDE